LRVEPGGPARARLRPLRGERRRHRPRPPRLQPDVRRLPDVLARRPAARVLQQPPQREAGRDERLRGGLGPVMSERRRTVRRFERLVPWLIFLLVVGGTLGVVQYFMMKLLK